MIANSANLTGSQIVLVAKQKSLDIADGISAVSPGIAVAQRRLGKQIVKGSFASLGSKPKTFPLSWSLAGRTIGGFNCNADDQAAE